MDTIPVLVLVGPTASGKTDLLLSLCRAGEGGCAPSGGLPPIEVVSADSMQAYRGMDIGTAKPGAEERSLLPHHLIDIREPDEQYGVGDFVRLADEACSRIAVAGKLPVVAGGTGFYVRNFLYGLPTSPAASVRVRAEVAKDLSERGEAFLRAELEAGDPVSAARIHANDGYRLMRAIEVLRQTGKPLSAFAASTAPREGYDFLVVEVSRPRAELYSRIEKRVDAMFAAGLCEEVARLTAKGYGPLCAGMKAIGYREFFTPGAGSSVAVRDLGPGGLGDIALEIKLDTRRYAKRQETFFRGFHDRKILPLEGEDPPGQGAARLSAMISSFLGSRSPRGIHAD